MPTYRYQEVAVTAEHQITCGSCGKKRKRQRTFTQTVNPFNRNEDGTVKTSREVYQSVCDQANAWPPPAYCATCEAKVR